MWDDKQKGKNTERTYNTKPPIAEEFLIKT